MPPIHSSQHVAISQGRKEASAVQHAKITYIRVIALSLQCSRLHSPPQIVFNTSEETEG